jgi:hypothetical protein
MIEKKSDDNPVFQCNRVRLSIVLTSAQIQFRQNNEMTFLKKGVVENFAG